jgi:hypothetical protein
MPSTTKPEAATAVTDGAAVSPEAKAEPEVYQLDFVKIEEEEEANCR